VTKYVPSMPDANRGIKVIPDNKDTRKDAANNEYETMVWVGWRCRAERRVVSGGQKKFTQTKGFGVCFVGVLYESHFWLALWDNIL